MQFAQRYYVIFVYVCCSKVLTYYVIRVIIISTKNERGAVKLDKKIKKLVKLVQQLNKLMIEIIGLIGYILIIKDLLK